MSEQTNYLYGGPDDESIDAHDLEEYVDYQLDRYWPNLPAVIEVQRYTPMGVNMSALADRTLEYFWESVEEDYGFEEIEFPVISDEALAAFNEFVEIAERTTPNYNLQPDGPVETVDVCEYVSEHHPDWFSHPALNIERREDVA